VAVVILGLHETIWPALGFVLILSFIGTVFFSHRVAGPIYRLEKAVDDFVRGDFKPIHLRKSDEFKEIEASVNRLARYLGTVQALDAAFHDHLKKTLSQLAKMLKGDTQQDGARALAVVEALVAELDSKTNAFALKQEA
jgi:HAMP domain-containing protein